MPVEVAASAAGIAFAAGLASFRKIEFRLSGKSRKRGWRHVAVSGGSTDGHSDRTTAFSA
jgi:hypothetical protein